jgi:hypothetical protein
MRERHWDEAYTAAQATARKEVFPFLRRRRYTLTAGMGTFVIRDRRGKYLETDLFLDPRSCLSETLPHVYNEEFERVLNILNISVRNPLGEQPLGSLSPDFPETRKRL